MVIETTFVNAVDAPSLALLIPVVQRGLKQRCHLCACVCVCACVYVCMCVCMYV